MVELRLPDESKKLAEVVLGLAGEPDDEGRADRDPGDASAEPLDHAAEVHLPGGTAHALEHRIARVLEGDVDVLHDLLLGGDRVHDLFG